jgi:ABC-2 type transport system permease protein
MPILMTALPVFLGRSVAGANASANFQQNTGTANYVAYLIIGSNVFMIVTVALWNIGFWMRREQQTGTLEALYLAPVSRLWIVAGVSLYGTVRSLATTTVAFTLGCLIFGVNPLVGNIGLAFAFLIVGMVPLYGISFLYGALVLPGLSARTGKVKEASALINLAQWVVNFLMGIYFPITVFPPLLRWLALSFPPTWMTNGVRASLLGVGFFFERWYGDFAILWVFVVITPLLGYWVFLMTERAIRREEGVGQF